MKFDLLLRCLLNWNLVMLVETSLLSLIIFLYKSRHHSKLVIIWNIFLIEIPLKLLLLHWNFQAFWGRKLIRWLSIHSDPLLHELFKTDLLLNHISFDAYEPGLSCKQYLRYNLDWFEAHQFLRGLSLLRYIFLFQSFSNSWQFFLKEIQENINEQCDRWLCYMAGIYYDNEVLYLWREDFLVDNWFVLIFFVLKLLLRDCLWLVIDLFFLVFTILADFLFESSHLD